MNKTRLVRFIDKYYLKGTVNSIVLNSNGRSDKPLVDPSKLAFMAFITLPPLDIILLMYSSN